MQLTRSNVFGNRSIVLLVASLACSSLLPLSANAQQAGDLEGSGSSQPSDLENVEVLSPSITGGLFSIPAGKRLMSEAESAYSSQNFDLAANKLKDARQIMNQLSNFYSTLTSSFLGVDRRVSESHRRKALETAQLRDQSTYQLALVYRAQNKPEKAIPLLIEIIRSQSPSRDLGKKSYQQLVELGFSEVAYPRTPGAKPTTSPDTAEPQSAPISEPTPETPTSVPEGEGAVPAPAAPAPSAPAPSVLPEEAN